MNRRNFLTTSLSSLAAASFPSFLMAGEEEKPLFEISLAEWSLHRTINGGKLDNLDFPKYSKEQFGITAVEYVNGFFFDKAKDMKYLGELKKRSADEGVTNVLIMIDREGHIGAKTSEAIDKTVDRHKKWVEAAKFLGCHSIRVNAHGHGNREEAAKRVTEGLSKLATFAKDFDISICVENHGGLSSDGAWVEGVLKAVNMPNCGSLPDFGNFHQYDRYKGIKELMPFAKGVSAKSRVFNEAGEETQTDYWKAMKIVLDAGYRGHVGIEWEGGKISEQEGIKKTKELLLKVRDKYSADYK
ncbi:Sugar phosphate isomerase/epimerase [Rubritalea squalenifaciens DSM 18772]|uniref:Sugar phosphate isomerase/epimerase n=2 Tax=Rubritalea TaxID=361050 RepID=A0A1M6PGI0_9BACT|nr:TIM barrel protein [Rubritalea squalenifaciens]SHK07049.1 Sugar phosphate isomerase/epimerase [Rubritalea squalenifaciens DSM 18772]